MRYGALRIGDELDPQPITAGEIGLRLRCKPYLLPSLEFGEQRSVGDGYLDHCGVRPVAPEVLFLVCAGMLRQDLGRDLDFDSLFVGQLTNPMLKARAALIADGLEQIRIRHQVRPE